MHRTKCTSEPMLKLHEFKYDNKECFQPLDDFTHYKIYDIS